MVAKPVGNATQGAEATRKALMDAAIRLFASQGYEGTTVKDIADAAKANISMISYHFDGKEGLYRACIESFGRERLGFAKSALKPASSIDEFRVRLEMFVTEMIQCHMDQPNVCNMIHREVETGFLHAKDLFKSTFQATFETFVEFLVSAQKSNLLRADLDPRSAVIMVIGTIVHLNRTDEIVKRVYSITLHDPKHREKVVSQIVGIFLNGVLAK